MVVQPGNCPAPVVGSTPVALPAVRQAPLKKYQGLIVLALVKSSLNGGLRLDGEGGGERHDRGEYEGKAIAVHHKPPLLTTPCWTS